MGTIHQNQFKPQLDRRWAYLVYAGLWWELLRRDLDAYLDSANAQVSGTIGVKLYKGHARVVTRESPNAVYDQAVASFGAGGAEPGPEPPASSGLVIDREVLAERRDPPVELPLLDLPARPRLSRQGRTRARSVRGRWEGKLLEPGDFVLCADEAAATQL